MIMASLVPVFIAVLLSKADSACINTSAITHANVYLQNNLYGVTSASSILHCAAECYAHTDCHSFGFELGTRTCHQHVQNSTTTSDMKEKKNWLHSDVALWQKTLLGPCSNHNCKAGERCLVHRVTEAPICVKAEMSLPRGYCPVPVLISNAKISPGKQLGEGSVITYTCNHGYMDLSLNSTQAETICMANGKWSETSLNCSGPYIRLEMPPQKTYIFTPVPTETVRYITGNTSTLIFLIRSCSNSIFHLYERYSYDDTMKENKVVIGGWWNSLSVIQKCTSFGKKTADEWNCFHFAQYTERGILSCEEFRPFWFSWKNGKIRVGKGQIPGDQVFMEGRIPGFPPDISIDLSAYINNTGTYLFIRQI